jgi:predicted kinase
MSKMIRTGINDPDNPLVVLGLSEGNIIRLKNGQPIYIPISSCGVNLPGKITIVYGVTEYDVEGQLRRAGLISNKTRIKIDKRQTQERAIISEYDHVLLATVGLPRSGKSTWAKSQAYPIVNPDSVRLAIHGQRFIAEAEPFVWATVKAMVKALFLAGHRIVILDATNTTRKRRDEWQSREWATFFKVMDTPKEVCLERAISENDMEILPIIERMAEQFEPLGEDENLWPQPS